MREQTVKTVCDERASGIFHQRELPPTEEAQNSQWDAQKPRRWRISALTALLRGYEPAYTNFLAMSPSVKKTYTRAYLDAKTDPGREKRLLWMVDRLNKNLKPM